MHSTQTFSSQQFPQHMVKFQHRFILLFDSAEAGKHKLLARAKDARGGVQPDHHNPNLGSYVINHALPIEVFVQD